VTRARSGFLLICLSSKEVGGSYSIKDSFGTTVEGASFILYKGSRGRVFQIRLEALIRSLYRLEYKGIQFAKQH
jgi:hypothetical protein